MALVLKGSLNLIQDFFSMDCLDMTGKHPVVFNLGIRCPPGYFETLPLEMLYENVPSNSSLGDWFFPPTLRSQHTAVPEAATLLQSLRAVEKIPATERGTTSWIQCRLTEATNLDSGNFSFSFHRDSNHPWLRKALG